MEKVHIRPASMKDAPWLEVIINEDWGGLPLVIRGKKYFPIEHDGLIAEKADGIAGLVFFEIIGDDCEIIVLEVFDKFKGIGTQLIDAVKDIAQARGCRRVFLMTTNDNLDALRFYQKRGFFIYKIHLDSVKNSRAIKPSIGLVGDYGIAVRDEIDLECLI